MKGQCKENIVVLLWSNGLVVKALYFHFGGPNLQKHLWHEGLLSHSYFRISSNLNFVVKSKLPPRSGSEALEQLKFIHKKGP